MRSLTRSLISCFIDLVFLIELVRIGASLSDRFESKDEVLCSLRIELFRPNSGLSRSMSSATSYANLAGLNLKDKLVALMSYGFSFFSHMRLLSSRFCSDEISMPPDLGLASKLLIA